MKDISTSNFGLVVAYLVPGFTAVIGLSHVSFAVRSWLAVPQTDAPTLGGFLYVTLASIAAGMTVSAVRWLVVDSIHHRTGIHPPRWDFARLQKNVSAYSLIVEHQYRYYQFYGGMVIAIAFGVLCRLLAKPVQIGWLDVGLIVLAAVFFIGSRDTLRKYYARCDQFMREQSKRPVHVSNGRKGFSDTDDVESVAG